MAARCSYSCRSAAETLEWINAIIDFVKPYTFLLNTHVVNFFKERLWEAVDKEWINCLRNESVENLVKIPSGMVQDHWPTSLKEFVLTLQCLAFPREQVELETIFPDLYMPSLDNVLTQGMNLKKRHEVEVLSAVISSISMSVGSHIIVDVGAGQGYLAQVLCFHYQIPVVAIDASSHHGKVTSSRSQRIKKHYAAKMCKSQLRDGMCNLDGPMIVTCEVLSTDSLKALANDLVFKDNVEQQKPTGRVLAGASYDEIDMRNLRNAPNGPSLLLAGLHACGDLSVTMLRTFLECSDVKAVISIGCCYNLLSEQACENADSHCGFPMSRGVKCSGFSLGKSSFDLACQTAERWKRLGKDASLHNFVLHTFRAAFQMLLCRYYPEVLKTVPAIGRQGKALRRQQQRRSLESSLHDEEHKCCLFPQESYKKKASCSARSLAEARTDVLFDGTFSNQSAVDGGKSSIDKCSLFIKFSKSGLNRLSLTPLQDNDFREIWNETEPFAELIGPYWSLRAALGPLLETLLLLDRLLYLQEQGNSLEAVMLPIFDPALSPRNLAIIAKKN